MALGSPSRIVTHPFGRSADLITETEHQKRIDAHFEGSAAYWTDIYEAKDVEGTIYRDRRSAVLAFVQKLALPAESSILEVGCGSGLTSVELARKGYTVQAVDSVDAMIERTRQHAQQANVSDHVIASVRDVYDLGYPDKSFHLVLKIGVAPWLHSLDKALREVARVLRPGGYLITTADNSRGLNRWLDPRYLPPLAPLRRFVRYLLERLALIGARGASARLHSIREFDASLSAAGLRKIDATTVGFGPFSFLGFNLLPDSAGVRVDQSLQHLADRGLPILRAMGKHYIVLARRVITTSPSPRGTHHA